MTDKLADLVLPDTTPVEELPEQAEESSDEKRPGLLERITGDWLVSAGGIGLAFICAVFPWYIFFHQEEFGIRPLQFSEHGGGNGSSGGRARWDLEGEHVPLAMGHRPELDFIPTGTVSSSPLFEEESLPEQPFPGDRLPFSVVHAANGRAMIEDADGFWIVQRGSALPDGSRVAQILQRDGTWVVVTSEGTEVMLSQQ